MGEDLLIMCLSWLGLSSYVLKPRLLELFTSVSRLVCQVTISQIRIEDRMPTCQCQLSKEKVHKKMTMFFLIFSAMLSKYRFAGPILDVAGLAKVCNIEICVVSY